MTYDGAITWLVFEWNRPEVKGQGQVLKFIRLRDNSRLDEANFTRLGPTVMYDGTITWLDFGWNRQEVKGQRSRSSHEMYPFTQ